MDVLKVIERRGVNLHRSYFDTFTLADTKNRVVILSLYILREEYDFEGIAQEIRQLSHKTSSPAVTEAARIEKGWSGSSEVSAQRGPQIGRRKRPCGPGPNSSMRIVIRAVKTNIGTSC